MVGTRPPSNRLYDRTTAPLHHEKAVCLRISPKVGFKGIKALGKVIAHPYVAQKTPTRSSRTSLQMLKQQLRTLCTALTELS